MTFLLDLWIIASVGKYCCVNQFSLVELNTASGGSTSKTLTLNPNYAICASIATAI